VYERVKLRLDRSSPVAIHQQLREQIQAALHVGQLRPGDRLPSLRVMARRYEVNPKTVLRAYRALKNQGIIEVRPGSGAVVGGETIERREEERALNLLRMARRHRAEALTAGLTAEEHRSLLARLDKEREQDHADRNIRPRIVVLECNSEQATLFSREITRRLHVPAFPLMLPAGGESAEAILRMADLWVTTDFHYQEIKSRAEEHGRPCLTLRLDPGFSQAILAAANRGTVLMVHADISVVPAFHRALSNVGVSRETLDRIRGVSGTDLQAIRRELASADAVYVSPLCPEEVRALVPKRVLLSRPKWHIASSSIEALRAMILTLPTLARESAVPLALQARAPSPARAGDGEEESRPLPGRNAKIRRRLKR